MSIQPVNRAAEHLINSTPVLENKIIKQSVNAYLIKNTGGEGVGGGALSQAVERIGRSIMSQSIL